ncbi:MAG: DUF4278 domain-containing protein [Synechococcales cyanobacterium T60_A2020_003]|nr:DUF4278 domain-containing protein [Synechococcales cyanobacterium T60_A2020_003]
MQLTYRGQQYNPNQTSIISPELPIYGTYRGQKVTFTESCSGVTLNPTA